MTDGLFVPDLRPEDDPRVAAVRTGIRAGAGAAGPLVAHATNLAAMDGAPAAVVLDLGRRATSRDPMVDATAHGFPFTHVSTGLIHADLLDEQIEISTAAVAAATARSNVLAEMTARGGRAYAHHLRGDVAAAIEDATRAFEISRASDTPYSAWWLVALVEAHLSAGDADAARAALALQETVTIPAFAALRVRELEAAVALVGGDPEAALSIAAGVEEARSALGTIRLSLGAWEGRGTLARALLATGRGDEARATARRERERTADAPVARHRADALTLDGIVRGPDGRGALEEAVALLRTSPARVLLLRALLHLGIARRGADDPEGAREALLEALELTALLGVPRRADEVLAALRTVGARPRQAVRSGFEALTPAELDVARLAASGLGNPDIAARRHVSRKTVETHLGRAYRKLGITSRAALQEALRDAG
jgi:DNA-binding NarL/FixJ family response regulator